jgi:hypothetical protein
MLVSLQNTYGTWADGRMGALFETLCFACMPVRYCAPFPSVDVLVKKKRGAERDL